MRTVAHLSDLHFGRTDPVMVECLLGHLHELAPDLIVISGDFTQRARSHEFAEARAFLDALPSPFVSVPGNHDIALYNLYGRFVERLDRYRRYIAEEEEPYYADDEIAVACLNTARSLTFKGGRINARQVMRTQYRFRNAPPRAVRILVVHHPLDLPHGFKHDIAGRSRMALERLGGCAIDLILSGHLHVTRFADPAERLRIGGHSAILVQAGTAVSTRGRGEPNSFNVLAIEHDAVEIREVCWSESSQDFSRCAVEVFLRSEGGWTRRPQV